MLIGQFIRSVLGIALSLLLLACSGTSPDNASGGTAPNESAAPQTAGIALNVTQPDVVQGCIALCKAASVQLDSQCLGELDKDWVCDVAHNPRQPVDDVPANQCAAYRDGTHSRFVEVTPDCSFIRKG